MDMYAPVAGYGFCEFRDNETAQSAIRNLNNTEINGRQVCRSISALWQHSA
jgi:hypothetical protein